MTGVRRALLLSTAERYFALVANFATAALVSRILTPAEIGVAVVGAALVGVALSLREFASSSYLIQRPELSREDVRTAFTVTMALTAAVAAGLWIGAPWAAAAYSEPRLVPYFHVIAACLFIDVPVVQTGSLLRREMAFGRVAAMNVSGAATTATTTLAFAALGFSFMSFAWGALAGGLVACAAALMLRPQFWAFRPRLRGWREMVTFGGYNGATVMLVRFADQLPFLLLGRLASMDAAGLFSRGVMICQLPDKVLLSGALQVTLPAFAAVARQGKSLKQPYLNAVSLVTGLFWPAHLVLALLAYPIVDLVFGPQWHAVVPLVQIVALASLFAFSFDLNYPVLVSIGAIRDVFLRALLVFPVAGVIIALAVWLGGMHGAAWSMWAVIPLNALVSLYFVRRRIAISWADLAGATWRSAVVAATTALGPLAVIAAVGFRLELSFGEALLAVALAAILWLLGLRLTRHVVLAELLRAVPAFRRRLAPA